MSLDYQPLLLTWPDHLWKKKVGRPAKDKSGQWHTKQTWEAEDKPIIESNFGTVKKANAAMKYFALNHRPEPVGLEPELDKVLHGIYLNLTQAGNLTAQIFRAENGYMACLRETGLLGQVPFPNNRKELRHIGTELTRIREGVDRLVEHVTREDSDMEDAA